MVTRNIIRQPKPVFEKTNPFIYEIGAVYCQLSLNKTALKIPSFMVMFLKGKNFQDNGKKNLQHLPYLPSEPNSTE